MKLAEFKTDILPLKNKIFRYALSIVKQPQDAQDIAQDVLIKCWEELKTKSEIDNIEAWCIRVTRNRSLDILKKKGRNPQEITSLFDLSSDSVDPHRYTNSMDIHRQIKESINTLPVQQREVIALRDIQGYSYREIAAIMKINLGHVKVLLHRARKSVRELLINKSNYGITKVS